MDTVAIIPFIVTDALESLTTPDTVTGDVATVIRFAGKLMATASLGIPLIGDDFPDSLPAESLADTV